MGDLLWQNVDKSQREDRLAALDSRGNRQGVEVIARSNSVWAGPDKVSCTSGVQHAIKPRGGSDKRAYMWQTIESYGFRRLPTGTIVPYRSVRDAAPTAKVFWRNTTPTQPFDQLTTDSEQAQAFREACEHYLGIRDFVDLYPAAGQMGIFKYVGMPWILRGHYRAPDVPEFTARAFGKTRVSKRLIQAVEESDPMTLSVAQQMRGLVATKKIIKWLEMNPSPEEDAYYHWQTTPCLRKIFLTVSPETLKSLVNKQMDGADRKALGGFWFANANQAGTVKGIDKDKTYESFSALALSW